MQETHSYICHVLRIALVLLALESVAFGQITNVTDDQSTPTPGTGHDYIKMVNETVDPANGSLSIRIGVPVPPGRGLTLPFSIAYDSNGAMHAVAGPGGIGSWMSNTGFGFGGWSNTLPVLSWSYRSNAPYCDYLTDFVFQDATGGRHFLGLATNVYSPGCAPAVSELEMCDDLFCAITQNYVTFVMVADRITGTAYSFSIVPGGQSGSILAQFVEDRNGNRVTLGFSSSTTTATDTLGRTLTVGSGSPQSVQVPGLANPYQVYWAAGGGTNPAVGQTADSGNSYDQYCYQSNPIYPYGIGSGGVQVVTSVTLPNGQQYQFSYDSTFGLLSQITYPTGGWVKYTWGWNSRGEHIYLSDTVGNQGACGYTYDVPAVTERQVSFDGSNVALDQTFTYATNFSWSPGSPYKTTTVTTHDINAGATTVTQYAYNPYATPNGPYDLPTSAGLVPMESSVTYKDGSNTVYRKVNKTWSDQYLMTCESTTEYFNGVAGPTIRTDYNPGAVWPWASKKEWDWNQAPACGSNPSGSPRRETDVTLTGFPVQVYPSSYFTYNTLPYFNPPLIVTTNYNGAQAAQTTYVYDSGGASTQGEQQMGRDANYNVGGTANAPRGNAISKTQWLGSGGSPLATYSYDDNGQMVSMIDPCGNANCPDMVDSDHTTQFHYSNYNAYLSEIDYPSTSGVPHKRYFTYNSGDGQLASSSDENTPPNYTSYEYNDSLGRLTEIDSPDGGKTSYGYANACAQPYSTSIVPDYNETATVDGLCHITLRTISDPEGAVKTSAAYDGFGRVYQASNPYRSLSDPTYGVTTYAYDPLGRTTNVTNPDQSFTSTVYGANCSALPGYCSTVTDAANRTRRLWNDGLGRLTGVSEDPNNLNYQTTYSYNGLDDLLAVSQSGQSRSFTYDSLSRLTQAQNPELNVGGSPCPTNYTYDSNGNLMSKVAPLQNQNSSCSNTVTTSYGYDALNRVLYKNYTDLSTVRAAYAYDGIYGWGDTMVNPIGHLTSSWSVQHDGTVVAANEFYQFDPMGRVQEGRQCTPATCGLTSYPVQTGYDLMGNEINLWESSLARYNAYDAVGRLSNMSASSNVSPPALTATGPGSQPLINISAHSPFGGLTNAALGNGLAETRNYTNRGWLGSMWVGSVYTLSMGYAGNGNVTGAIDSENGNWTYTYDGVNRLQTASGNGQSFSYNVNPNPWGNMTCTNTGNLACSPLGLSFNSANNQISTSGYSYDAAGNLLSDNTHGYVYDGENRLVCVQGSDGTCTSWNAMLYFYDPQGQRVGKQQADTLEDYVYDLKGHIASVHDGSTNLLRTEFYPPDGRHVATLDGNNWSTSNLFFTHADWLGTERARTDHTGVPVQGCTDTPYGMNIACNPVNSGDVSPIHFTGLEYDPETGMSHALNRQYPMNIGRWLTADPAGKDAAHVDDPQTWNMYAYVRNNPTTLTDLSGLSPSWCHAGWCQKLWNLASGNGFQNDADAQQHEIEWLQAHTDISQEAAASLKKGSLDQVSKLFHAALDMQTYQRNHPDMDSSPPGAPGEAPIGFPSSDSQIDHIFRNADGHVADTPANRELLQSVANDPAAKLGTDQYGNTWSARTLPDGTQAWTQTRGTTIVNGGVNQTPRAFNPQTGLKEP